MKITMEDIDHRLKVVEENTAKILFYLESDPTTNKKGFVENLENTERRVRILELDKKIQRVQAGTIAGIVSVVSIIIGFVIQAWLNNKFK